MSFVQLRILSQLTSKKILTFVGDNATSNDKQMTQLHQLPNQFESINHILGFHHTMQLSSKALLQSFAYLASTNSGSVSHSALHNDEMDDTPGLELHDDDEEADEDDNDEESGDGGQVPDGQGDDEIDNGFESLGGDECEDLLDNTADVWSTLDKVCQWFLLFSAHIFGPSQQYLETLLCYCSLHYDSPSSLGSSLHLPFSTCPLHPP